MNLPSDPKVQVSWGELLDKFTILEIKEQRLSSPAAIANVRRELELLSSTANIIAARPVLASLKAELRSVNEALWEIEDEIRLKEAAQSFDQHFVDLARSVYLRNDERGRIKRRINEATKSEVVEEKQYADYRSDDRVSGSATQKRDQSLELGPHDHHALLQNANLSVKRCKHGLMIFHTNDIYIGRSLDTYGEFSESEIELLGRFLRPGMTVVDVGANIGVHAIYFADAVGASGQVLAFEPQRVLYQLLCGNVALNRHGNVFAVNVGLGAKSATSRVPKVDYAKTGNFGGISLGGARNGEEVVVRTLDSYKLKSCHLVKIDVEGMEQAVLEGAKTLLAEHAPILYVENDRAERSGDLIDWLRANGYRLYWHRPRLFNPKNYFSESQNVFGDVRSLNLLCVPRSKPLDVGDLREITA